MVETLLLLLKIFVVFATAGSLLELGLQLELRQTVVGLRNPRFALLTLFWGSSWGRRWRCCWRGRSFSTNHTPSASS
jgi:hypothetical protein